MKLKTKNTWIWLPKELNKSIIGSGKISRRITPYRRPRRRYGRITSKSVNQAKRKLSGAKYDKSKQSLKFPSVASKRIFSYWNRLGHPFVKHRLEESKTTASAIQLIEKTLRRKKITAQDIFNAIDECHSLFTSEAFRFRNYYSKNKLGLNNFFRYSNTRYKQISAKLIDQGLPKSWFNTCHTNRSSFLKEKYLTFQEKNPEITEELTKIWVKYAKFESPEELTWNERLHLKRSSARVKKFYNLNRKSLRLRHWSDVTGMIDNALNMWGTMKPKGPQVLSFDSFWQRDFPAELIRANYGYKREEIKIEK